MSEVGPVDAGSAQVVYREPHEAPTVHTPAPESSPTAEDRAWLDAPLGGPLPEYDEADDGFAAVEWDLGPVGMTAHPTDQASLTVYQLSRMRGAWWWHLRADPGDDHGMASWGAGCARTEVEAKRAAYDAWRAFEAMRREVAGDV